MNNSRTGLMLFFFPVIVFSFIFPGPVPGIPAGDNGHKILDSPISKTSADHLFDTAEVCFKKGDYDPATRFFIKAAEQYEKDKNRAGECRALKQLGVVYLARGLYEKARDCSMQALKLTGPAALRELEWKILNNLGVIHYWQEKYNDAAGFYTSSLAVLGHLDAPEKKIQVLDNLGLVRYWQQRYPEAQTLFLDALAVAEKSGTPEELSQLHNHLGDLYYWTGDRTKAIYHQKKSLSLTKNREKKIRIMTALGNLSAENGQMKKAVKYFRGALEKLDDSGNAKRQISVLDQLALALLKMGDNHGAVETCRKSIAAAREAKVPEAAYASWGLLGRAQLNWGRTTQAIDSYRMSLSLSKKTGNIKQQMVCLLSLGGIHREKAAYIPALDYYSQLYDTAKKTGDKGMIRQALVLKAELHISLGDYSRTIALRKDLLDLARVSNIFKDRFKALVDLADAWSLIKDYDKSLDYLEQALNLARLNKDRSKEVEAAMALSGIYRSMGQFKTALSFAESALDNSKALSKPSTRAEALYAVGVSLLFLNDPKAVDTMTQLVKTAGQPGLFPLQVAQSALAMAYAHQGRYQDAIDTYQKQLELIQSGNDPESEGQALVEQGLVYLWMKQFDKAQVVLEKAIVIWEGLRFDLSGKSDYQISLLDAQANAYLLLQEALVQQKKFQQALEVAELGRARTFADRVAAWLPETGKDKVRTGIRFEKIAALAKAENATLVEYSTTLENLYIWVVRPDGKLFFRTAPLPEKAGPAPAEAGTGHGFMYAGIKNRGNAMADMVQETRRGMVEKKRGLSIVKTKIQPDKGLQGFFDLLIRPIRDFLPCNPDDQVVFIPTGGLFLIPFAALMDENGKYLIEKHTIRQAPSIEVLGLTRELSRKRREKAPESTAFEHCLPDNILVVGNPEMPDAALFSKGGDRLTLSPLPGSEHEARQVAQIFNAQPLIGKPATKKTVTRRLPDSRLIHLATHGLLDYGDPEKYLTMDYPGAVVLSSDQPPDHQLPGHAPAMDGLLTAAEIRQMELTARLAVLSACNTGQGRITADGVVGLSRAFVTAGVPSVIVSLWSIPDLPTAELMIHFYRELKKTGQISSSLRHAMLKIMHNHASPLDWAGFTLIGAAQ